MAAMTQIGRYNVRNNGNGTVTAQHEIIALEIKTGPVVAVGNIECRPEGRHGIRMMLGSAGAVTWPNGELRKLDKQG